MTGSSLVSVAWDKPNEGLDWRVISVLSSLLIEVKPHNFEDVLSFVQRHARTLIIYSDCSALNSCAQVVALLNAGCVKVFLGESLFQDLLQDSYSHAHRDRLVLFFSHDKSEGLDEMVGGHSQEAEPRPNLAGSLDSVNSLRARTKSEVPVQRLYVFLPDSSTADAIGLLKEGYNVVIPSSRLSVQSKNDNCLEVHRLITDVAHSDRPDGLVPTIVVNERGESLGLVYSSRESIAMAIELGRGVYYSRSRKGLWVKGEESGNTQQLLRITLDCDADTLQFRVKQNGKGFCHLQTATCFGPLNGISQLNDILQDRKEAAPPGSYSARLFKDPDLLKAKIMEEADELCNASSQLDVADEAADLIYFTMAKCVMAGVQFQDIEKSLDRKSLRVTRRKGDAKAVWVDKAVTPLTVDALHASPEYAKAVKPTPEKSTCSPTASNTNNSQPRAVSAVPGGTRMKRYKTAITSEKVIREALQRPSQRSTENILNVVKPIINDVREGGDQALLRFTHKFEKAISLSSPVIRAPFPQHLMDLPEATIEAIDTSFDNIRCFHAAQKEERSLEVETMHGVVCSRFSRPIERVGLYVPGGTAVLPSTALMLGVPAMVAGCKTIVLASPPRMNGSISPEIVYIADKIGAESIVLAGGAQAIAALAYGTESVSKVDKILGPGNQYVTAGKMIVSNDTNAGVSIDMPAGPSEVLVVADKSANPAFVASDLLSQAEHGVDSQVILIAVALSEEEIAVIEAELQAQARILPRFDIIQDAIAHSVTLSVSDIDEAMRYSNEYAPEHLILQVEDAEDVVNMVQNAGSVFVGHWTPESVGDYSAGTNHSLPTYGYARQYSGVNLSSFTKHITCSNLTKDGLRNVGGAVMQLAKVEQLEAHRRAVSIRLGLDE